MALIGLNRTSFTAISGLALTSVKLIRQQNVSTVSNFALPELMGIKGAGLWKNERVIASPQRTRVLLTNGVELLNFCANNYLGLSNNKEVIEAAKDALDKYGAGLSSVRFICGTQEIHVELEKKIAEFHGKEDAILYASCYDANLGIFASLLTPADIVLSDSYNHASIIDGIKLSSAKKLRYFHRDMADLENHLQNSMASRLRLIVTDGVFSMDGTVAPLPQIVELAKKYHAITLVDDCHATGCFGPTGRGTEDYFNQLGSVDIINSTLGKALGGAAGGYTTGSKSVISLLRQRSRPYLFSNSLPPPVIASASKAIDLIQNSTELLDRLKMNTQLFRSGMNRAGFKIADNGHPICIIPINDAKTATEFAESMSEKGIYVVSFSHPVVQRDKSRIRVQINATHTPDDIELAVNAFVQTGKRFGIIH